MIHVLVCKGEGLSTEEMSMRSTEKIRASFGNTETGQSIALELLPEGRVILKMARNLRNFTTSQEVLFEGTLNELAEKLGAPLV